MQMGLRAAKATDQLNRVMKKLQWSAEEFRQH